MELLFWDEAVREATAERPLKAKFFYDMFGISKRELRDKVAKMRENGELVVGNPVLGYFMAKDWEEYDKYVRPQMKNCFTYLKQYNALKRIFTGRDDNQLVLELNLFDDKTRRVRMEHKRFKYQKKSNGQIGDREVLVLRETTDKVEGIDLESLTEEERAALERANRTIIDLTKNHYKCFLKENIKDN